MYSNITIDNGTDTFVGFITEVKAAGQTQVARQLSYLFNHYAHTMNHGEVEVANRLIALYDAGKLDSINNQAIKLGYAY